MIDETKEFIEDDSFSYDDYEIVRGEFLSRTGMPAICFDGVKVSVNTACLRKMPEVRYVQFLINSAERKLVLRPCGEDDRDSFLWCKDKNGKLTPRKIVCRLFSAKLAELMGWSPDRRYRIMGAVLKTNSERLMFFDLNNAEAVDNAVKEASRKSCFPEDWRDYFGLTVEQQKKSIAVNIFDDFTVIGLNR